MLDSVIFDFDGTLVDSSPGIFHTALYTVRELGITEEFSDADLRRFVGPPLRDCFHAAFNLDPSLVDRAVEIYREEYQRTGRHMMKLYPGMKDALSELSSMGMKLAVATFKGEDLVNECVEELGISEYFSSVHGSDRNESRTKGRIIEMTMEDMHAPQSSVIMIGDTVNDLKGAENAHVAFLPVTYGFGFTENDGLDPSASSPVEIPDIIKKLNGGIQ